MLASTDLRCDGQAVLDADDLPARDVQLTLGDVRDAAEGFALLEQRG